MKLTTEQLLLAHRIEATQVSGLGLLKKIEGDNWFLHDDCWIPSSGSNEENRKLCKPIDFSPLYDWIEHDGGECPVREDDVVIATGSSGNEVQIKASELDWGNITRFMLHPEWPEQRADDIGRNANEGEHYAGIKAETAVKAYTDVQSYIEEQSVKRSKYHREIAPGVWVDVYDVLKAWQVTCPALQHLIKKALQPGERGHKTLNQDMKDIVASAIRAQELASKPED